jgi:tetratricopeptide (TPR) repeat protein
MPKTPSNSRPIVTGLGIDVPELQQARALWQLNRFDESLELFEKAVRKYPQNLLALVDASRAFGARFEIARAEALLDRLMNLAGRSPKVLQLAGQSYRMLFRPEKAMDCLQRAVALDPKLRDAQLELAVLCERRHRLEDALAAVEKCLHAQPDYHEARLMKARLLRRTGDETGAESFFRDLTGEKTHPLVRAQAWAEIAQSFDRHGQYDEAMASMLRCKELLRPHAEPFQKESAGILRILLSIVNSVTPEHLRRWAEQARAFPEHKVALLTSFPRSGTTLLEQVLDSHSGLISSDEREAFARDIFPTMWMTPSTRTPTLEALDTIPQARLETQRERYLGYMSAALNQPIGDRVHLDKNPPFTLLLPAILRLFPEMKLLIALRDPRDVILSCFMQYLPLNTNSVCYLSLEETVTRYAADMGAWQSRRALNFLGLNWEPEILNYRERLKTKPVSSPTYEAVRKPLYTTSVGRWKHYQKYFEPMLGRLAPFVEAFGYE